MFYIYFKHLYDIYKTLFCILKSMNKQNQNFFDEQISNLIYNQAKKLYNIDTKNLPAEEIEKQRNKIKSELFADIYSRQIELIKEQIVGSIDEDENLSSEAEEVLNVYGINKGKPWSCWEENYLRNNYRIKRIHEISTFLGRTNDAVRNHIKKLNISKRDE